MGSSRNPPRAGVNNSTITSNGRCICDSYAPTSKGPWFNYQVRYSENGQHAVPCIANQTRTVANAKHNVTTPRQVRGKCGFGCPSDAPGDPRLPCPPGTPLGSSFCNSTQPPGLGSPGSVSCADASYGAVVYFPGSTVQKGGLAGSISTLPFIQVQTSDLCGNQLCPGGQKDGDKLTYNSGLAGWTAFFDEDVKGIAELKFQSEEDSKVILGDGSDDPLYLDRDYLAAHLLEILGPARLAHAGWKQAE